jgi:hypothetical protein
MSSHFRDITEAPEKGAGLPGLNFVGNGQNLLPVPGLKSAKQVLVSNVEVPETVTSKIVPEKEGDPDTETVPLWRAIETPGGLVLQRGEKSNWGVWQKGADIRVNGVLAPAEVAEVKDEAPADKKPADDKGAK